MSYLLFMLLSFLGLNPDTVEVKMLSDSSYVVNNTVYTVSIMESKDGSTFTVNEVVYKADFTDPSKPQFGGAIGTSAGGAK
jgi:hypothetical protein